jgi:hypothetical protein
MINYSLDHKDLQWLSCNSITHYDIEAKKAVYHKNWSISTT